MSIFSSVRDLVSSRKGRTKPSYALMRSLRFEPLEPRQLLSVMVWLDYLQKDAEGKGPDFEDDLVDAWNTATGVPQLQGGEIDTVLPIVRSHLEDTLHKIYENWVVVFSPMQYEGTTEVIYFGGAMPGQPTLYGRANWDWLNENGLANGASANVFVASFGPVISEAYKKASKEEAPGLDTLKKTAVYVGTAIGNVAAHEVGHLFGLQHGLSYGDASVKNPQNTGGVQRDHVMSAFDCGMTEADLLSIRTLSQMSRSILGFAKNIGVRLPHSEQHPGYNAHSTVKTAETLFTVFSSVFAINAELTKQGEEDCEEDWWCFDGKAGQQVTVWLAPRTAGLDATIEIRQCLNWDTNESRVLPEVCFLGQTHPSTDMFGDRNSFGNNAKNDLSVFYTPQGVPIPYASPMLLNVLLPGRDNPNNPDQDKYYVVVKGVNANEAGKYGLFVSVQSAANAKVTQFDDRYDPTLNPTGDKVLVDYTISGADVAPFDIQIYRPDLDPYEPGWLLASLRVDQAADLWVGDHTVALEDCYHQISGQHDYIPVVKIDAADDLWETEEWDNMLSYRAGATLNETTGVLYVFGTNASVGDGFGSWIVDDDPDLLWVAIDPGAGDDVLEDFDVALVSDVHVYAFGNYESADAWGTYEGQDFLPFSVPIHFFSGDGYGQFHGGSAADVFVGEAGSNLFYGGGGNDVFFAGPGGDSCWGQGGNDILYGSGYGGILDGGDDNDLLVAGPGGLGENLYGGDGDDTYAFPTYGADLGYVDVHEYDDQGNDTLDFSEHYALVEVDLSPTEGREFSELLSLGLEPGYNVENAIGSPVGTLFRSDGNDNTFYGGTGDDVYVFSGSSDLGCDTIYDEGGNDTLDLSGLGSGATVDLAQTDPQTVAANLLDLVLIDDDLIENVVGTALADVILGNGLANALAGGGGNDTLEGRAGNDDLSGGDGDDYFRFMGSGNLGSDTIADSGGDFDMIGFINLGTGINLDLARTDMQTVAAGHVCLQLQTGQEIERASGTAYGDTIRGNDRDNYLYGSDGNDVLEGRGGDDFLDGSYGNDTYVFNGDSDLGSDTIAGEGYGDAADVLDLRGFVGSTQCYPYGGIMLDLTWIGEDQTVGDNLTLNLWDLDGIEDVWGTAYADVIFGNNRDNELHGWWGDDWLLAGCWDPEGSDEDVVDGGYGDDFIWIWDEAGDDVAYGGPGYDLGYWDLEEDEVYEIEEYGVPEWFYGEGGGGEMEMLAAAESMADRLLSGRLLDQEAAARWRTVLSAHFDQLIKRAGLRRTESTLPDDTASDPAPEPATDPAEDPMALPV